MHNYTIKVLIVDDSLLFREKIKLDISKDKNIEVVGTAEDPFDARDKIISFNPDVLVLDVEMPKMNGIEFLKKLMPQHPIPVVVVSSQSNNVFEAMKAGAVDFVSKPQSEDVFRNDSFISELIIKIKIASIARVSQYKREQQTSSIKFKSRFNNKTIIAIGASTGGTEAIFEVIKSLPRSTPGIVIVQHMPPVFTRLYAERLNNSCKLYVKEAEDGDVITNGKVLIAPGDFHMALKKGDNDYFVECYKGEKINGHCPSVDVLFNSLANTAGKDAIGIILTGMGSDGARGLLNMRKKGATTIGQDESSCIVYGMPKVAYEINAVEKQASLGSISQLLFSLSSS